MLFLREEAIGVEVVVAEDVDGKVGEVDGFSAL
jgi:hypothetical protein